MRRAWPLLLLLLSLLVACGPEPEPIEAWNMTLHHVSECSLAGGGQNCTPEDELKKSSQKGRWIFEYTPDATLNITLHTGATLSGITFDDDNKTLEDTPPCFGQGGTCLFARDRSASVDQNDNDCGRGAEHLVVARVTVDGDKRSLEAVVSDRTVADDNCTAPAFTEVVDSATGVLDPKGVSRAQSEQREGDAP